MKNRILLIVPLIFAGLVFLTSCQKNETDEELKSREQRLLEQYLTTNGITETPTSSGLYYISIEEGNGAQPVDESWVEIEYVGELVDGTVFASSYDSVAKVHNFYDQYVTYGPTRILVGGSTIEGINEGLQYMKVGGKAKLIMPSDLAFGSGSAGDVPSYSTLIYTIDLLSSFNEPGTHERELIQQFLVDSNFIADSTASGLYYIEQVAGDSVLIKNGDQVEVEYTGYFFDGRIFDSNVGAAPITITVGITQVIEGWVEGLKLMSEGSKGILIVPWYLAYGSWGYLDNYGRLLIPPYMTLVFEMEVKSVT